MNAREELRQQMWELCYDLLPPDERQALVARIKSDPQAARLYAEVRLQTDLVGYAAKVEDSSLVLSAEGKNKVAAPAAGRSKAATTSAGLPSGRRSKSAGANWLSAAAALVLVGLIGYGYFRPLANSWQVAERFTVTEFEAPSGLQEGLSSKIQLRTRGLDRDGKVAAGQSAEVAVRVLDQSGYEQFHQVVTTDAAGKASVDLPGGAVQPGMRVEAEALAKATDQLAGRMAGAPAPAGPAVSASLAVEAEPPVSFFLLEKPVAAPGETVKFAMLNLKRFSLEQTPAEVDDLIVQSGEGEPVVHPMWQAEADGSRILGEVQLPPETQFDALALARDKRRDEQPQRLELAMAKGSSSGGGPAEQRKAVAEQFYLQQGQGAETARTLRGTKEPLSEASAIKRQPGNATDATPATNRSAELERDAKPGEQQLAANGIVPAAVEKRLVEAGQPVSIEVPAKLRGRPLVAKVICRDVTIAALPVLADEKRPVGDKQAQQGQAETFSLDLPPEADGEIRIALSEAGQSSEAVLHEEIVYRRPARELKVQLADLKAKYAPGEKVQIRFQVRDESDRPTAAEVGVRLWNEDLVRSSGTQPMLLADAVRSASAGGRKQRESLTVAMGGVREQQFKQLGDDHLGDKRAYGNMDLKKSDAIAAASAPALQPSGPAQPSELAATPAAPEQYAAKGVASALPFSDGYVAAGNDKAIAENLVASNRDAVEREFRSQSAELAQQWQAWQSLMGKILIGGGLAVLVVLGLILLARRPIKASGTLSLVAAAASLAMGLMWVNSQPLTHRQVAALPPGAAEAARSEPAATMTPPPMELPILPHALEKTEASAPVDVPAPGAPQLAKETSDAPALPASAPAAPPATTAPPPAPGSLPTGSSGKDQAGEGGGGGSFGGSVRRGALDAAKLKAELETRGKSGADERQEKAGAERNAADRQLADIKSAGEKLAEKKAAGKAAFPAPPTATSPAKPTAATASAAPAGAGGSAGGSATPGAANLPSTPMARAAVDGSPSGKPAADARETDKANEEAAKNPRYRQNLEASAPASLYFNPRLLTDEQGYATIEFEMPAVASEYRLLIDAVGGGRIGGAQTILVCEK